MIARHGMMIPLLRMQDTNWKTVLIACFQLSPAVNIRNAINTMANAHVLRDMGVTTVYLQVRILDAASLRRGDIIY